MRAFRAGGLNPSRALARHKGGRGGAVHVSRRFVKAKASANCRVTGLARCLRSQSRIGGRGVTCHRADHDKPR